MRPDSVSISIRKLDPTIAKYLIDTYGAGWPDDVELWEKVPTDGDNRHWIDVLSGKAAKADEAGDPLVDQFYLTNVDTTELIRDLGKLIDAKKQEKSGKESPYLDGQIVGLRTAIKAIQGDNAFTVGESKCDVYKRTCERIYTLPWRTNEDGLSVYLEKSTWREWLRELDEVMDGRG
jgi:hypothetical protein